MLHLCGTSCQSFSKPELIKTCFLSVGPKHLCRQMQSSLMWFHLRIYTLSGILNHDHLKFSSTDSSGRWEEEGVTEQMGKEKTHTSYTITDNQKLDWIAGTELWLIVLLKMTLKCSSGASCSCREVHTGWGQTVSRSWFSRSCWCALAAQANSFRSKLLA